MFYSLTILAGFFMQNQVKSTEKMGRITLCGQALVFDVLDD